MTTLADYLAVSETREQIRGGAPLHFAAKAATAKFGAGDANQVARFAALAERGCAYARQVVSGQRQEAAA